MYIAPDAYFIKEEIYWIKKSNIPPEENRKRRENKTKK